MVYPIFNRLSTCFNMFQPSFWGRISLAHPAVFCTAQVVRKDDWRQAQKALVTTGGTIFLVGGFNMFQL